MIDTGKGNANFGPRGMAYLKAIETASQDGALKAARDAQGNPGAPHSAGERSVLGPVKSEADKYFAPQDKVDIKFPR